MEHLQATFREWAVELGGKIGALIGLGIEGEEGAEAGALAGAERGDRRGRRDVFTEEEGWDVLEIPNGYDSGPRSSCWNTSGRSRSGTRPWPGGRVPASATASSAPLNLVEIGLMEADEAKTLHDLETSGAGQQTQPMTVSQHDYPEV